MKKVTAFSVLLIFLLMGAMMNSCQKEEFLNVDEPEMGMLKNGVISDYELPLYMDQDVLIGYAVIKHLCPADKIQIELVLNELEAMDMGWEVKCAQLYVGEEPPETSSPGLFPYKDCEAPFDFADSNIEGEAGGCSLTRIFSLHLELMRETDEVDELLQPIFEYETAWVLLEDGMNWYNKGKKGSQIGWGQYFEYTIVHPTLYDLQLKFTTEEEPEAGDWWLADKTNENAFSMCLDPTVPYYYFDATMTPSRPLAEGDYDFFLTDVESVDFGDYWEANMVGWPQNYIDAMEAIIAGTKPMFTLRRTATDYLLIDGFQFAIGHGEKPLRINGEYPAGTYGFTGEIIDKKACENTVTIFLTVAPCEAD